MKLGSLDQRVSASRVDVNRNRFVGRMTATEVHVQGDTIAMVAPSGSDVQLSLANLDGIILQQVLPKVDLREDWTSTPFSVIALSPDQSQLAIAPSKYAGLHPDSMFDDYVTGSTLGIRATEQRFIVYVYGVDGERRQTHPGYLEPTWTPDGHVIMVGDGDVHPYGLYRLDPATERVERIDNGLILAMANDPAVSPDGQRIAFAYQGQIWSMDIQGTALTPLARSPEHDLIFPVWSPDGTAIAYLKRRTSLGTVSALYVIDLADDQNEYFHDLRRKSGTGEWELFEPWGCLSWTRE